MKTKRTIKAVKAWAVVDLGIPSADYRVWGKPNPRRSEYEICNLPLAIYWERKYAVDSLKRLLGKQGRKPIKRYGRIVAVPLHHGAKVVQIILKYPTPPVKHKQIK
jgi:hypothetical protein